MPRIRTIKPEFFLHEELYDLEEETGLPIRISFAGLWCHSDREGRFKWQPRRLKTQILPYDQVDFSRVLDALTTRGFVEKYAVAGVVYGSIPTFLDHQVINNRERASTIPKPSSGAGSDACPTRGDACPTPLVHALVEGKGKEQVSATPSEYAFEGETIKLNQEDYDDCLAKYPNIDLDYQLSQLDSELRGTKKWFPPMHSKLNYRNRTPAHQAKSSTEESYW